MYTAYMRRHDQKSKDFSLCSVLAFMTAAGMKSTEMTGAAQLRKQASVRGRRNRTTAEGRVATLGQHCVAERSSGKNCLQAAVRNAKQPLQKALGDALSRGEIGGQIFQAYQVDAAHAEALKLFEIEALLKSIQSLAEHGEKGRICSSS